jgi:hypothetical protein
MKIFYPASLLALSALAACSDDFFSQTVDIDPPAYDKQLVVHEFVADTDISLRVELTRNFGILEDVPSEAWPVPGAVVRWYDNGELALTLTPLPDSPFVYTAALPQALQAGHTYELRAEHADYPAIRAVQTLPAAPAVDSVVFRATAGIDDDGEELQSVDVYLRDPGGQVDYYELRVAAWQLVIEYETDPFGNWILDSLGLPIADTIGFDYRALDPDQAEDPNAREGIGEGLFVSDRHFDGQPYKFAFRMHKEFDPLGPPRYRVTVRAVTEAYYQYALSRRRAERADDNPLAEPVTVFDNIEGGIGLFGLFAQRVYEIE